MKVTHVVLVKDARQFPSERSLQPPEPGGKELRIQVFQGSELSRKTFSTQNSAKKKCKHVYVRINLAKLIRLILESETIWFMRMG